MPHLVRFVDSVAAAPTIRLDVSDGTTWRVTSFDASPPRLRRSMSQNAMTDGGFVSSSQYEMRTVKATLWLTKATQDLNATQLQQLGRELNRDGNYLMYQPMSLSKPVFFRTVRSDFTSVREVPSSDTAVRAIEIEVLAEPFALGLRETLGPFTVNNDPAAGSNGCFFDVTGVLGDVDTPFLMVDTSSGPSRFDMAVRQHGTPSAFTFVYQCESMGLAAMSDTTNPGGGPDAAMSGTGTNNFVRTTFATLATLSTRLLGAIPAGAASDGTFRILAVVRRSDSTSSIQVQVGQTAVGASLSETPLVTLPLTTNRQLVDLGTINNQTAQMFLGSDTKPGPTTRSFTLKAGRTSGAGSLDWDVVFLIPADEAYLKFSDGRTLPRETTFDLVLDGDQAVMMPTGANIYAGDSVYPDALFLAMSLAGSPPRLVPNQTNRIYLLTSDFTSDLPRHTKTDSEVLTLHYFPRYLYVRPSGT
jgi:hypothetical protein